jgi:hypothetical protein
MKKLTEKQDTKLTTMFESFWSLLPTGVGAKVGHGTARDAFKKPFKKVREEEWLTLFGVIKEEFAKQEAYRRKMVELYPDERTRKQNGVFLPSRPNPTTWLKGERWKDEARVVKDPVESGPVQKCISCEKDGTHYVEDNGMVCAWHWTRKYNKVHLRLLADTLASMGLSRKDDEPMEDWGERCRDHLRTTGMGKILGA